MVDLLIEIEPYVYGPYVKLDKNGTKVLILHCLNAIYGTMVASLLYYNKFCRTLKRNNFVVNPYNCCTANRMVDGKQQTILWNVDDCKISRSKKTNDGFIEVIRDEYEKIFKDGSGKMTVSRGKNHKYLGMDLDFTTKGEVKVTMVDYTKECIKSPIGIGNQVECSPVKFI